MKKFAFITIICANFLNFSHSQTIENKFISALINKEQNLADFIDNEELSRSSRLGITYTGIKYKWLISFDIPEEIKQGFRDGKYDYTLQTQQLEDGFSEVTLAVGSMNYLQKFFFLNDMFVPPARYYTKNWQVKESRYFKFRISEPKYFNDYCVKRLDDFVDSLCIQLDITNERKKILEKEKIYYTLCTDEDEVEKIAGYKSKGMSVLAFDEVITAYQTHFHEVAHLLVNYKLQNLGLYTLPVFMEGFAVAVGGRGGMAPRVVTDLGYFLQETGFLTYDSILTYDSFYRQDANMTYAVSGLYNSFLLNELGSKKYLELYKNVNGDLDYVKTITPHGFDLPDMDTFKKFLNLMDKEKIMHIDDKDTLKPNKLFMGNTGGMEFTDGYIKFFVNGLLYFGFDEGKNFNFKEYVSRIYIENENREAESVTKYCLKADSSSVSIYNLLNDELIYSFNKQLSLTQRNLTKFNNFYTFFINKSLFINDSVKDLYIRIFN